MSNVVPDGWGYKSLSDIANVDGDNLKNSTALDYKFKYIDIASVSTGQINIPSETIEFESSPSRARKRIKKGDVLMATVRPNLQAFASFDEDGDDYIASTGFAVVRAKKGNSGKFILNTILSDDITKQIDALVVGSNYPAINSSDVKNLEILTPPLPEQQKIAKILTSVDEVIEKTQAQIDKLKDLKTGMMQELLTNGIGHTEFKHSPVGRIPAEWEVVTLGDVTIESAFGPRFSSDEYAPDGNFGCIRTTDMDENWDVNYSTAPLARLNFKEFEKHILVDGDLLVTRSGTCGLVDVFREQPIPMVAAAFLIRFRLTDNVIPQFVKYLMMSTDIQESVQLLASGGVQKNLSGTSLKTLKIPKPSIQEQIKIVKAIESINNRLANSNKKLSLNKKLKKALMQDLLTGKVRVKINS